MVPLAPLRWISLLPVVCVLGVLVSFVPALVVPAWAGSTLAEPIRIAIAFEPETLDPQQARTQPEITAALDLFEGLLTRDAAGEVVPGLAEAWHISPDGLTWTFTLRAGLTFSDGHPLTAAEVVASFHRLRDPATLSRYAVLFDRVAEVAAQDPRTVMFRLTAPLPYLDELLANFFALIVPVHAMTQEGDASAQWMRSEGFVGSGPYRLAARTPGALLRLVANPAYHAAQTVVAAEVAYQVVETPSAALTLFRSGDLDIAGGLPQTRIAWLEESFPDALHTAPMLSTYYLLINTRNTPLDDPRVRRALALAIDRDLLTRRVLAAGEVPASAYSPPDIGAGYTPPVAEFSGEGATGSMEARRARARALLEEAGYGPDRRVSVEILHGSSENTRRAVAAIRAMAQMVGISLRGLNTDGKVLFSNFRARTFEVGFAAWVADYRDPSAMLFAFHSQTPDNRTGYASAAFDALYDAAMAEPDPARRADLLAQAEAVMLADAPVIPLYHGVSRYLVSPRIGGWQANSLDVHPARYLYRKTAGD